MANVKTAVTTELHHTLETHPGINEVHFTADGHHHFRVFEHGGKRYTRLEQVPETTKAGIHTGRHANVPIKDLSGKDDARYAIVETASREDVLKTTPVGVTAAMLARQDEAISVLGITKEEFAEFMAKKNGTSKKK